MGELTGQVAIVTGGASGIGEAIVHRLATMEAAVAVFGRNSSHNPERVADDVVDNGGIARAFQVDVADRESVEAAIDWWAGENGRLDILVNNAAVTQAVVAPSGALTTPLADLSPEEWHAVIDINLNGVFYACRASVRQMLGQRSGRIISITSRGGFTPPAGLSAYAASKAGVTAMMKSLAKEVAHDGITVNCVAPGLVMTPLALLNASEAALIADASSREGIGALIYPADVAGSVAFLCLPDARYITGETIHVNAGAYMP